MMSNDRFASNQDNQIILSDLRQSIDHIDTAFIFVIAERLRLMTKSIAIKQQQHLSLNYSARRKEHLEKTIHLAIEHQLNEQFIHLLFERIYQHAEAINERRIQDSAKNELMINYQSIQNLQDSIYHLDVALCCLLAERYHLVHQVGYVKKKNALPPLAIDRWQKILSDKLTIAAALNIDVDFIRSILELIHQESLRIEADIISE